MNTIITLKDNLYSMKGRLSAVKDNFKKKCGGKEVIMEFALGAIAVALAIVFRTQLKTVIESVGSSFSTKITELFTIASS